MLTPLDIQNKKLRRSFRGYKEEEVDEFLDQLAQDYEWLYLENQRLKEKLQDVEAGVARYREMEQAIKDTLLMAQKNADELRDNTQRESELLIKEARQKAKEIVKEAEENANHLVSMAEERAGEIIAEAENKVQSILNEYARLERQFTEFRVRFRSFLDAQINLFDRQEKETMESLPEVAAGYIKEGVAGEATGSGNESQQDTVADHNGAEAAGEFTRDGGVEEPEADRGVAGTYRSET